MVAKIISIVNQKGGAGKTTLTMQLGGTLGRRGIKVQIFDGDPQNSAVQWSSLASEKCLFPAKVCNLSYAGIKIHQEIKKFGNDSDYIIIDCPPAADSDISKSALLISDIVLVPFIPDALNMLASVNIRETINSAKIMNENLRSLLVLNRVEQGTTLAKTIVDLLPDFNMEIAKTKLHKRTHYAESVLSGTTVHYFKHKAKEAIKEIELLCDEIIHYCNIDEVK